jgi:hypothetical protein
LDASVPTPPVKNEMTLAYSFNSVNVNEIDENEAKEISLSEKESLEQES